MYLHKYRRYYHHYYYHNYYYYYYNYHHHYYYYPITYHYCYSSYSNSYLSRTFPNCFLSTIQYFEVYCNCQLDIRATQRRTNCAACCAGTGVWSLALL